MTQYRHTMRYLYIIFILLPLCPAAAQSLFFVRSGCAVNSAEMDANGLQPNCIIKSGDVDNALAFVDDMVLIKGGTFDMGSTENADEKPVHPVTVSDFYLAKYEVTVQAFRTFVDTTGYVTDAEKQGSAWGFENNELKQVPGRNWRHDPEGGPVDDNHPVIYVSWNDAVAYCQWMSQKTGKKYRLPTEAEWEYAAGNGSQHHRYSWGSGDPSGSQGGNVADETIKSKFADLPVFSGYSDGYIFTAPVGSYQPNTFGLYDMTGNVWEWCSDWYDYDYYAKSPLSNPQGPKTGSRRVCRGGSWYYFPVFCRVANRYDLSPDVRTSNLGFRLAMTP